MSFNSLIQQAYSKSSKKRSPKGKGPSKPPANPRVVARVNTDSAYAGSARPGNDPAYKKSHPTSRS